MKQILAEIQSGDFAREWIAENRAGQENFKRMREEQAGHQVEVVGKELRVADGLDRHRVPGVGARPLAGCAVASAYSRNFEEARHDRRP